MSKLTISLLVFGIVFYSANVVSSSNAIDVKGITNDKCLDYHNAYRAKHGSDDLAYDSELEQDAIERANVLADTDDFKHDKNNPNGENLYMMWTTEDDSELDLCKLATDSWYNEAQYYDYDNPGFSMETGHFTQLVWKGTTKLGCAKSKSQSTDNIYVVCNYKDERGNIDAPGYFEKNVLPPQ